MKIIKDSVCTECGLEKESVVILDDESAKQSRVCFKCIREAMIVFRIQKLLRGLKSVSDPGDV